MNLIKDNYYEKYGLVVGAVEYDGVLTIELSRLEVNQVLYTRTFVLNGYYENQTDDLIDDCVFMYERGLKE